MWPERERRTSLPSIEKHTAKKLTIYKNSLQLLYLLMRFLCVCVWVCSRLARTFVFMCYCYYSFSNHFMFAIRMNVLQIHTHNKLVVVCWRCAFQPGLYIYDIERLSALPIFNVVSNAFKCVIKFGIFFHSLVLLLLFFPACLSHALSLQVEWKKAKRKNFFIFFSVFCILHFDIRKCFSPFHTNL